MIKSMGVAYIKSFLVVHPKYYYSILLDALRRTEVKQGTLYNYAC